MIMKNKFKLPDLSVWQVGLFIFVIHFIIWIFAGNSPVSPNPYNSYVLQAEAWADGYLDLGQNYSHLEIAEYNKQFFISFPQFPAMVYYPFALLGMPVPEGIIAFITAALGGMVTCMLLKKCGVHEKCASVISILTVCGSNLLFVTVNPWVWFIAQNMCYTLTVSAIYCACKKRGFAAFLLLACAVGCRPFQLLYTPLLCVILMNEYKKGTSLFIKNAWWFSGAAVLGCIYMWLNFARFGNVFEFGHNYLPEFIEAPEGQFSTSYVLSNLYSLIKLPPFKDGKMVFPQFNGFNIFIVSPVFAFSLYCFIRYFRSNKTVKITALVTVALVLLATVAHRTMGGWHFGNRYTNDCIPAALVIIAYSYKKENPSMILRLITLYGLVFNVCGTVAAYIM